MLVTKASFMKDSVPGLVEELERIKNILNYRDAELANANDRIEQLEKELAAANYPIKETTDEELTCFVCGRRMDIDGFCDC